MIDAAGSRSSAWKTFGELAIYDNLRVRLGEVDVEQPDDERYLHNVVRLHRVGMTVLVNHDGQVPLLWTRQLQPAVGLDASDRVNRHAGASRS